MVSKIDEKKSNVFKILLFILWPFGAFLYSIKNLKSKSSLLIIFLFFILFGYTFLPENEAADSFFYAQEFNERNNYSLSKYLIDFNEYIKFDSNVKDFYVATCTFLVLYVEGNYHLLMALFAFIFAYFYIKSFKFFIDRKEFVFSPICYLIAFLFTFSNPIFNINGVRFWTAAWVSVYVLFQLIINKNRKYLFLLIFTPIIHISYFSLLFVIVIYFLLKKFEKGWIIFFFVSFSINNILLIYIASFNDFLPVPIQNMIWSYTDTGNLSLRQEAIENTALYARVLNILPYYFINAIMIILIYNRKKIIQNDAYSIYVFLLVWFTFVNLTWSIPSFGARFISLGLPMLALLILISYKQIPILAKAIYLIPIVYSYSILNWFRNMISISDPLLYLSNLFHLIFKNS